MAKTKKKVVPKKPLKKSAAPDKSSESKASEKAPRQTATKSEGKSEAKTAAAGSAQGKGSAKVSDKISDKTSGVKAAASAKGKPLPEKAAKKPSKEALKKSAPADEPDDADQDFMSSEEDEEIKELAAEFNEDEEIEAEEADDTDDEDSEETLEADSGSDDIVLTDAEGNRYCRVRDCDQISMVDGYCRYHYLLLWKKIQVRKKILTDGKLEYYIVELTSRYPDKFLEMIRKDLRNQKDFLSAIQELEIDESGLENDYEEEDTQSYIDEVRGMGEGASETVEDDF